MMSTLLPAHLAPPQDERTRAMIQEHIRQSKVNVINGELIVSSPGARITFARRDKDRVGPRSLSAYTRFVLTGLPDRPHVYERSVIVALFEIALGALRSQAPERIRTKYNVSSFVTRLTYQVYGGSVVNDYGPCFRSTGHVKVNDQTVDVLMKILS